MKFDKQKISEVIWNYMKVFIIAFVVFTTIFIMTELVSAEHTDTTFCGGYSSRDDSNIHLALVHTGYIYSSMVLTVGSSYNTTYEIYVNNTLYDSGDLNSGVSFQDITVNFQNGGMQPFNVIIGSDNYSYDVNVLKRSYEAVVEDGVIEDLDITNYVFQDLMKVYGSSLIGCAAAVIVAYVLKIDKIKREPRRVL